MPITAFINLRALSAGPVSRSFHCLMHPVFLDRISKADPAMSKSLHDAGMMTPFSLSPVMGADKKIVENESYRVRIGILNDELEKAFTDTLEKGVWREPVRLEEHLFQVEDVVLGTQKGNQWSGKASYQDMIFGSSDSRKISLSVASPLSFKRGDLHYPLPEPALIFGNLSRRWNLFAPFRLPENIGCENVSYSYLNIRSVPFLLRKGGTIFGITGKLTFVSDGPPEERLYYHALLRFAFYSGIGVKTTQGMGMCRILPERDS